MLLRHFIDGLGLATEMLHRLCFAAILGSPAVLLTERVAFDDAEQSPHSSRIAPH